MKKSQLQQLVREVLQETIRKVDGKYVVYPEKGGKRLGTHTTRKAAEKQLTAIHLNKEDVNEIGDASASPYSYRSSTNGLGNDDTLDQRYLFTTDSGIKYLVLIEPTGPTLKQYSIAFASKGTEKDDWWSFNSVHSKGEVYRVMSTVVSIIKDFLKKNPKVFKLVFSPSAKDGEGVIDNQRYRLYTAFIKKQIPDAHVETNESLKLIFITLHPDFSKSLQDKEDVNEIGDANPNLAYNFSTLHSKEEAINKYYSFETDTKILYRVLFNYDYERSDKDRKGYEIAFTAKIPGSNRHSTGVVVNDMKEMPKVMATVVKIIKTFLKNTPGVTELQFAPTPKGYESIKDNKRAKLYLAYLKRQLPNALYHINSANGRIYIVLPSDYTKKLNEIGDASASPYPYTPDGWVDPPNFRYSFKTDSGIEYRVYIEPLDPYGSLEEYSISFAAKGTGKDDWWGFDTVHSKGELYKVMSTIVATIKDFLKINPDVTSLSFSPTKKSGEDYIDNQRSRLYSAFIKRQIPNAKVTSDEEDRLITIKLPKKFKKSLQDKEEEVNEIGDASAEPYDITIRSQGERAKTYAFTTDPVIVKDKNGEEKEVPGTDYTVLIHLNTFRSRSINTLSYDLSFEAKSYNDNDFSFKTVNEGNMFRVMATIVKIAKYFINTTPGLTELSFTPYPKSGESRIDNKRGKLYMAYVAKHLPDDVIVEPDYDTNRVFIKLPKKDEVEENYADGKVKGKSRPGRVKRAGASCKGSVTDLRAKAKKYGGEKGKMYHWCANMKAGKK